MNIDHICQHCGKNFSSASKLYKHRWGSCFWLNHSKRSTTSNYDYEKPLTDSEKDVLIRELLIQVTKLNKSVTDVRKELTNLKQKQKINILKHLNNNKKPKYNIQKWVQCIFISQQQLEDVFKTNITNGIINVLNDNIETNNILCSTIPMISFVQKPKTIYIYNNENKWIVCTNTILQNICMTIAARFFDAFVQWQKLNNEFAMANEESQEQFSLFTQKIMDTSYKSNINNIMEKTYISLQTTFQENEYVDTEDN